MPGVRSPRRGLASALREEQERRQPRGALALGTLLRRTPPRGTPMSSRTPPQAHRERAVRDAGPRRAHCERGRDPARVRGALRGSLAGCRVAASRRNSSIVSTRQVSPSPKQNGHSRLGRRVPGSAGNTPSPPHSSQRWPRRTLAAGSGEASSGGWAWDDRAAADMLEHPCGNRRHPPSPRGRIRPPASTSRSGTLGTLALGSAVTWFVA